MPHTPGNIAPCHLRPRVAAILAATPGRAAVTAALSIIALRNLMLCAHLKRHARKCHTPRHRQRVSFTERIRGGCFNLNRTLLAYFELQRIANFLLRLLRVGLSVLPHLSRTHRGTEPATMGSGTDHERHSQGTRFRKHLTPDSPNSPSLRRSFACDSSPSSCVEEP